MESRKIQVVGHRSYAISLPKHWVTSSNLKNHDSVFIEITNDKNLLIKKINEEKKNVKSITHHIDNSETLAEFLVFAYTKNIDHIRLHAKPITSEMSHAIRMALRYLEGYEITLEDENVVEISFLFNEIKVTIPKIIHRMYYLIKLQFSALKDKNSEVIKETEHATDRLYHLSTRILFSCMKEQEKREENNIHTDEDLIYMNNITKKLERIADNILRLEKIKLTPQDVSSLSIIVDFLGQLLSDKLQTSTLKSALESKRPKSKNPLTDSILYKIHDLCKDIFESKISMEFNDKMINEN